MSDFVFFHIQLFQSWGNRTKTLAPEFTFGVIIIQFPSELVGIAKISSYEFYLYRSNSFDVIYLNLNNP